MPLMTSLLRAALVAAALTAMTPLTAPAAYAEGASEHNQPHMSPYAYRHHRITTATGGGIMTGTRIGTANAAIATTTAATAIGATQRRGGPVLAVVPLSPN